MTGGPNPIADLRADLRSVRRDLRGADDEQIRRVVAIVDALPRRGVADALIAPLRQRLAAIKPPRRLSLTRLLFLPLDPLVVPAAAWKPGSVGIPRSVLPVLRTVVAAALRDQVPALEARIAGRTVVDFDVVEITGRPLWASAALTLQTSPVPADWVAATGLRAADHDAIARPVAYLLGRAEKLRRLARQEDAAEAVAEKWALAEHLLTEAAEAGADTLAMMLTLLLTHVADPGALLLLADDLARRRPDARQGAPDRALDFLLDGSGSIAPPDLDIALATDALRRAAVLLDGLADQPTPRPARAGKLKTLRQQLDETCRERFETAATRLTVPPQDRSRDQHALLADDAEIGAIEALALDLRRLETVGRHLGAPGFYDRSLRAGVDRLWQADGLSRVDRLRIAEIMLGADAALAMAETLPAA